MTYTIQDRSEETHCDYCGCPLEVGDKATANADESKVYCGSRCKAWGARAIESAQRFSEPNPLLDRAQVEQHAMHLAGLADGVLDNCPDCRRARGVAPRRF